MRKRSLHVILNPNGGWVVREGGSRSIERTFETQKQAIDFARMISRTRSKELFIYGRNGMIREKDSYIKDPLPK
jgi:hypothetical protein